MSGVNQSPHMTFRIASIEDLDLAVVPHWLHTLKSEFENCQFVLKSGASHENFSALSSRTADMIVAVDATNAADWVEEFPVLRDPYILVTGGKKVSDISALSDLPMIRYSRDQFMGRQIETQLRRVGFKPKSHFEFSSNQAVFSSVEKSGGWAITTALALSSVVGAGDSLTAMPLPMSSFSRLVSLYSRRNALGHIPARFAEGLREALAVHAIKPVEKRWPFLAGEMRLPEA